MALLPVHPGSVYTVWWARWARSAVGRRERQCLDLCGVKCVVLTGALTKVSKEGAVPSPRVSLWGSIRADS